MAADESRSKWYKIARADAKGKILDISDPNPEPRLYNPDTDKYAPKYVVNYVKYDLTTHKSDVSHSHYIDEDALALLAWDLMNGNTGGKGEKGFLPILDEYKGGLDADKSLVSRRFLVAYNEGLSMGPVYGFAFVVGEGVKTDTGAVLPAKNKQPMFNEKIYIPVQSARKLGLSIYRYICAKQVAAICR